MPRTAWVTICFLLFLTIPTPTQDLPSPADKFAIVNTVRLHFLDWGGRGAPILFLTGGGGTAHQFSALATKLTDNFRVLGLTRRGQGLSDKPSEGYDTTTLAEDIKAFLDVMHIDQVTLAGYSIAGDEQDSLRDTLYGAS